MVKDTLEETSISLPAELNYHGFNYTLILRGKRSCIYQQTYEGKTEGFEVSLIQIQEEAVLFGKVAMKHERWPKDGDFGKTAWTCWTVEEAMVKFNRLESDKYRNRDQVK